jgi:hypothetical protein
VPPRSPDHPDVESPAISGSALHRPRLDRAAEACLRCKGYLALRDISCEVCDGVLHLRGHLPSQYLKQVAQAAVAEVRGIRGVVNGIEVVARGGPSATDRTSPSSCSLP